MERSLSLEQRTERLVQRSQALLRPRSQGPERAKPLLGSAPSSSILDDPLVQWRLRRCRAEEPALDTLLVGRAVLVPAASQGGLQGVPRGRVHDPPEALQGTRPWETRNPPEAPCPISSHFCKPLHQGASSPQPGSQEPSWQEPPWWAHDSNEAFWPRRSSSLDILQGALYSQSRDSHNTLQRAPHLKSCDSPEALWPICSSHCASLHERVPPCGKRDSHKPLWQDPCWGSHDCLEALQCGPYWNSHDSQDALQPTREVFLELLHQAAPGLRSHDPPEAPQPISSSAREAVQGALSQPLGPLGDPLLRMLRCYRRAIRGRLRAIETLLELPSGCPQTRVGPIQ